MTIDKVILIKEAYLRNPLCNLNEEEREADQISIEALIAWRQYRGKRAPANLYLLPGETPE